MTFIQNFLSDQSVYALGWTIVHSIWQILVIALILRGLLNVFHNASSNVRYLTVAGSFITIILCSIVTFSIVYRGYSPEQIMATSGNAGIIQSIINQTELAQKLGVSYPRLNEIIKCRRSVTPDTALRLSRVLGMSADFWLGLQQDWDLWHAINSSKSVEIKQLKPIVMKIENLV